MESKYTILTSHRASGLATKVQEKMNDGRWKPVGSHVVTTTNTQNRFSGSQPTGTNFELEYSQTMVKIDL